MIMIMISLYHHIVLTQKHSSHFKLIISIFNTGDMKQMQQPCLHLASLELPFGDGGALMVANMILAVTVRLERRTVHDAGH